MGMVTSTFLAQRFGTLIESVLRERERKTQRDTERDTKRDTERET